MGWLLNDIREALEVDFEYPRLIVLAILLTAVFLFYYYTDVFVVVGALKRVIVFILVNGERPPV